MLVQDILANSAKKYKDKKFIQYGDHTLSFSLLNILSDELSYELMKIKERIAIGLLFKNSIEYLICYFSIIKAGHMVVPINPYNKGKMLQNILNDSKIAAIFVDNYSMQNIKDIYTNLEHLDAIFNTAENDFDSLKVSEKLLDQIRNCFKDKFFRTTVPKNDIAQLIYTSGTSGKPKGVCITHNNLIANMNQIIDRIDITKDDNMLVVIPFYYSYGNSLILSHLVNGATLTINYNSILPNKILDDLENWKCTSLAGVASNFILLLKKSNIRKRNLSNLKYITFAGEPVADWILDEFKTVKKDLKIYVMYGQTEATARISIITPNELLSKKGSIGKVVKGMIVKIVDNEGNSLSTLESGEIIVKGPNIMKCYWNDNEETKNKIKDDGFLYTNDIGRIDEEGYLYIDGRKDDMIKVGGERVFPLEIEKIIMSHPKVAEVGVAGIKESNIEDKNKMSHYLGSVIAAFIVPQGELSENEILSYCQQNLPNYKVPKKFYFLHELPKTGNGKLIRRSLVDYINIQPN